MKRKLAEIEKPESPNEVFDSEYEDNGNLEIEIQNGFEDSLESRNTQYLSRQLENTQTEAYDPHQDEKEVLEIRQGYEHLREELTKNSRELMKAESSRLSNLIDESNVVFSKVRTTSDATLDSRFLTDAADLGVEKVKKLPLLASEFTLDRYLGILNEYLTTHSWIDMGNLVAPYWSGVETCDFMLGPMELEAKQKKSSTQSQATRTRDENVPVVKPTVVNLSANENNSEEEMSKETSENVMKVYAVLENIGSFPLYHLITDPNSFARTVENMFYVSFLVRDNRVRVFIPEVAAATNELFIEAILPDDEESDTMADCNQMVLGMTHKIWRRSIEKYDIKEPILDFSKRV